MISIYVDPGGIEMRDEMNDEAYSADRTAVTDTSVAAMLGVVAPLCTAPPGVLMPDPTPHYLLESE
ncbi:hypothetical protein [Nocardia sp. NPDC019395]|uniref:hypothetical protein n=1 Tax=Nocardia sp. NPDC019395 TaxID=3154686 RepID=UPI0033E63F0A